MHWPVDPARYAAFLGVMAALAFTPGPSNLFSMALGMRRGRRAVMACVAGMNSATLVWYVGAALGLSAVAAALPWLFKWLALLGAAYLAWMAWGAFRAAAQGAQRLGHTVVKAEGSALGQGFMVQIANPKILLFFGAILPPFVDLQRPLIPQLALFAVAMLSFDGLAMSLFGLSGAALSRLMEQPRFRRAFNIAIGCVLLAVAALVALRGLT
jgi:threonine/homoserine/homoserine lactone efflux protein